MLHDLDKFTLHKNMGYYWVNYPDHPFAYDCGMVLFHRLVMENFLNRYLQSEEIIHHKDENKLNNDINNLELTNRSEHAKLHQTKFNITDEEIVELMKSNLSYNEIAAKLKMSKTTFYVKSRNFRQIRNTKCKYLSRRLICEICKKEFKSKRKNAKYCSYECSHISYRKTNWPSKDELEILVWQKPTTKIAKIYGVSDKAVEKWCKKYDIIKPPRGYWAKQVTLS